MPRTTPSSGAAGVVRTFPEKKPFGVSRTTSVKVPPISTASRQPSIISAFPKGFPDTNRPVTRTAHLVFDEGSRETSVPTRALWASRRHWRGGHEGRGATRHWDRVAG